MTRTLVTGATGFVGRHAVAASAALGATCALVRGDEPFPDEVEVAVWDGSAEHLVALFDRFAPDRILHLAAEYRREHTTSDVAALVAGNVGMTALVLEAARRTTSPVVALATTAFQNYGSVNRPLNLYAATKLAAREIARYYGDGEAVPWVGVVLYDVYGPGSRRPTLIGRAIEAASGGAPLAVPDGDPIVAPLYVSDAASAMHAAADAVLSGATPQGTELFALPIAFLPISAVIAAVEEVTGQAVAIADEPYLLPERSITDPISGDPPPRWMATVSLRDGLRRMLAAAAGSEGAVGG
jgi:nucleoside-diphosphate-sugar epimerase